MAPPTGPRAGSAASRSKSSTPRPAGRGGSIQKRRPAGAKTDRDGDVAMDATSANGTPGGRSTTGRGTRNGPAKRGSLATRTSNRLAQNVAAYAQGDIVNSASGAGGRGHFGAVHQSGRASLSSSKARFAQMATLKIHGYKESKAANNPGGGLKSLLEFLERKALKIDKQITIRKSAEVGDYIFIQVPKDDVPAVLHVNDFTWAGAKLTIVETDEPWPHKKAGALTEEAVAAKEQLKKVLYLRYSVENRILDLSSLGQDQQLVSMELFAQRSTAEKAFKALVLIADEQFDTAQAKAEAIQGVSLAGNELDNVSTVFDLAEHFPQLKMLDLSNNKFDKITKLSRWRHKFRQLENLVLTANPIDTNEPNYQTELLEWFPKLQIFNGVQVRSAAEIEAKARASRPKPLPQSGSDFRDADGIGEAFLRSFFPTYDTDRAQLLSTYYDDESNFTVSVVTHAPKESNVPVLPWAPYLKFSRNMVKIQTVAARSQRLFEGAQVIADLWKTLPVTKHPDLSDHTKYIIDCHPLPGLADPTRQSSTGVGGLIITAHGEFDEMEHSTSQIGKRSFSRTFVLGPGRPGRNAIRVLSDMLSLRAWNPMPQANPLPSLQEIEDRKKQMTVELSNHTNMTPQYSELCLSGVDWDFEKALAAFQEKKGDLPVDAFLTPGPTA